MNSQAAGDGEFNISGKKNPPYGGHWISWTMRMVAPIPKRTEVDRKGQFILFIFFCWRGEVETKIVGGGDRKSTK